MKELVARGHTVFALAPDLTGQHIETLKEYDITGLPYVMNRTGLNPIQDLANTAALKKTLRTLELDAVLTNTAKAVVYGTIAARLAKIPNRCALVSGLGYPFTDIGAFSLKQWIVRQATRGLYAIAFRLSHTVIFQNPDDLTEMTSTGVCPRGKGKYVLGSGVDLETHPVSENLPTKPCFIMVSRILAEKGVFEYLEAAKAIKADYPDTRFLLVGGTDQNPGTLSKEETTKLAQEAGVEWVGHVPDVRPWLQQASVFVLPYYYREGVPHSALQAMATGLAIITTDAPGCRETVTEGQNGLLIPPRDAKTLEDSMRKLSENPTKTHHMGKASRKLAEQHFDVRLINKQMCDYMEA